jgi:hypothetical protein
MWLAARPERTVGMRLNVYSEEIPTDIHFAAPVAELLTKKANSGVIYSAVRMFLHSSDRLHQTPMDDDRSAITFWLPQSAERREFLAHTFEQLAVMIRHAPIETGSDS